MPTKRKRKPAPPLELKWAKGNVRGVTFTFVEAGDLLELHQHGEGEAHLTFVRQGRLRLLHGDSKGRLVRTEDVGPGTWKVFEPGQWHGYEALTPGAKLTNVVY